MDCRNIERVWFLILNMHHFDNTKPIEFKRKIDLKQKLNTYRAKIRPLSDIWIVVEEKLNNGLILCIIGLKYIGGFLYLF